MEKIYSPTKLPDELPLLSKRELVKPISYGAGIVITVLLPYVHFASVHHLWSQYSKNVTRGSCSCSCWDTAFKGIYETGIANYKHVYINSTVNSFKIWAVTAVGTLLLSECLRKIVKLYFHERLRFKFAILFLLNIYPNYYSWWSFFNYWNDDYYAQWYHQLLFATTELISTILSVHLMDKRAKIQTWKLVSIFVIGLSHTLSSLTDQFLYNVVRGNGAMHQLLRDVGFFIPDLAHLFIPMKELKLFARHQHLPPSFLVSNRLFLISVVFVMTLWILTVFV